MSHEAIAAIWTQLEERADLATTLRDAVGQYAMQTALCSKDPLNSGIVRAFNRLVTIVRTAFHLQRTYLQSRQPSSKIEIFLIEPSLIIELIVFLLKIRDDCLPDRRDLRPEEDHMLRSIGTVLLAGLRLLTLYKRKVVLPLRMDWISKAEFLKSKLASWPLGKRVYRILIGELCMGLLKDLSATVETPLTASVKPLCGYHNEHSGTGDGGDLPDFYDGLYPLQEDLIQIVSRVMKCISCRCPWWFQSFCTWYDIWSALIGASVHLYRHKTETDIDDSGMALARSVNELIQEVENWEIASNSLRFSAIIETLFTINPFPQCYANGCSCFGAVLHHQYQELQYSGFLLPAGTEAVDLQLQIATDLKRRKHALRDADGYFQQVFRNMQESVRNWTQLEEERPLQPGQLKTYIINCPELHPLTSQVLGQLFEDRRQDTAAEAVQRIDECVHVGGIQCPMCVGHSFTQARLVTPLSVLDHNLEDAPGLNPYVQDSSLKIKGPPDRSKDSRCFSLSSDSLHSSSTSSRSLFKAQRSPSNHSRKDSAENASQGSPKSRLSRIFKSDASSPRLDVSSVLFTDGKFVLASTVNRISCYDCELATWSKGHSFTRITLIAGSSVRYAVVSKETQVYNLTVFRRDRIFEEKEWSKTFETQPRSIAISRQGHRIALGLEQEVQVFDVRTGNAEKLQSGLPLERSDIKIDSQQLSFSLCGDHLVVASRAARNRKVFVIVHDLHPQQRRAQQLSDLSIPVNQPGNFGLSSVVYDQATSSVFVFSSAAQENPWLMNRVDPRYSYKITQEHFTPFPGEQIQCAVAVPGEVPQIAMVNHSNKIFILRFDQGHWKPYAIKAKMEGRGGEIVRADEKLSIAAMDDTIRLFWTSGQDGRMLTIDNNGPKQESRHQLEKITLPF